MGLGYKSVDYVGELEGDARTWRIGFGGRKYVGAEVVCWVKVLFNLHFLGWAERHLE
jgi:hypothetical protein